MRLPLKVHAVKIRYREQLLQKMPHGKFYDYRGKRHVFVFFIPGDPSVTKQTAKRFTLTSKQGKIYAKQITQYIKVKAEYDELLVDWRANYTFEPPMVKFPIKQTFDPHLMDNKFFERAADNTGEMPAKHPVYSGDDILKSKNEQFGKDVLCDLGIPYKYEPGLDIDNPDDFAPDFLLSLYEIDRCIYAEICGMTDDYDYSRRTARKINFYSRNNYRQGREIIYCFMYDKYNFDEECFAMLVLGAYDLLIPDSAIDWENCLPPSICE
ncbi:MAG: hypothetical protein K6F45_04300 [Saccharofermentans sp.]|nr:hypothetical protein [Saccharofermentans sp.]